MSLRALNEVVGEERRWNVAWEFYGSVVVVAANAAEAEERARALSPAALAEHLCDGQKWGEDAATGGVEVTDMADGRPEIDAWWALHVRGAEWLQSAAKMALHALRRGATARDRRDARAALREALRQARYTKKDKEDDDD